LEQVVSALNKTCGVSVQNATKEAVNTHAAAITLSTKRSGMVLLVQDEDDAGAGTCADAAVESCSPLKIVSPSLPATRR
jgi:predicted lipoprotein with Yx(FWY)xxD motif